MNSRYAPAEEEFSVTLTRDEIEMVLALVGLDDEDWDDICEENRIAPDPDRLYGKLARTLRRAHDAADRERALEIENRRARGAAALRAHFGGDWPRGRLAGLEFLNLNFRPGTIWSEIGVCVLTELFESDCKAVPGEGTAP